MGSLRHLFLSFSLLGAYSMYYFAFQNGLIANLELAAATGVLPGKAHIPLVTQYTTIPLLDVFLRSTVIFFWPVTRGVDPPGISAYGCAFAGGMAAVWVLWTLENARRYSPVSALVRTTFQGLALQVAGPGVIMPLLLGWDLLHCPLRAARGQHLAMLNHLPAALLLGFLAPILGATFLCPTVISFDQCQMLIAFWQGWPIWTTVLTLTLFSIRKPATIQSPGGKKQATSRDAGQTLHAFAFACAATSHWILCISSLVHLASAGSSPSLVNLILPRLPWSHPKPSSVGEGVLWFLQWDYSIAAVAALIWSVTLWLRAAPHASVRGSARRLVLQLASWSLVSGPCGAAVVLMWKRNRLLSR